jgi:hypothetical protein
MVADKKSAPAEAPTEKERLQAESAVLSDRQRVVDEKLIALRSRGEVVHEEIGAAAARGEDTSPLEAEAAAIPSAIRAAEAAHLGIAKRQGEIGQRLNEIFREESRVHLGERLAAMGARDAESVAALEKSVRALGAAIADRIALCEQSRAVASGFAALGSHVPALSASHAVLDDIVARVRRERGAGAEVVSVQVPIGG